MCMSSHIYIHHMPVQSGKEIANDFRKSREIQIIAFSQKFC